MDLVSDYFSTFSKSGLLWVILIMHVDFLTILLSPHCVKEAGPLSPGSETFAGSASAREETQSQNQAVERAR